MQHDSRLREAARAIYNSVYPSEEWSPLAFEEAEQRRSIHYRNAVEAAHRAQLQFMPDNALQLRLF